MLFSYSGVGNIMTSQPSAPHCCICKNVFSGQDLNQRLTAMGPLALWLEHGHNAQPLADGRCCWDCNKDVIKCRLELLESPTRIEGNTFVWQVDRCASIKAEWHPPHIDRVAETWALERARNAPGRQAAFEEYNAGVEDEYDWEEPNDCSQCGDWSYKYSCERNDELEAMANYDLNDTDPVFCYDCAMQAPSGRQEVS